MSGKVLVMTKILCLESSTEVCSVTLVENGIVKDIREERNGLNHARLLTKFVNELLTANHLKAADLSAVAVSEGPGSYTGLRIGVSAAKGICYAVGLPLIAISPLQAMAYHLVQNQKEYQVEIKADEIVVPMIDARRMEVYTAVYNHRGEEMAEVRAMVIDQKAFENELQKTKVYFIGNGSEKCRTEIKHENAVFVDNIVASALNMPVLAERYYKADQFVDVAYFEPFYLKDFIATKPRNTVLNSLIKGDGK